MATPSISMPDEIVDAIDDRRHSRTSRSQYIREAIQVRWILEDAGEFESRLAEAHADDSSSGTNPEAPADD